jgi:hypothetical protein
MNNKIKNSVGRVGKNNVDDVVIVQHLLLQQGLNIGRPDGNCGIRTIAGITTFQAGFIQHPDGLVEPDGKTMRRLNMVGFKPHKTSSIAPMVMSRNAIGKTVPSEVPDPITRLVPRSSLGPLNIGLAACGNAFMAEKLGKPRETYTDDCQPITNQHLKKYVVTASVGPFSVTGLKPAVESLKEVMSEILIKQPEVYNSLGTVGMLCCRYQRDSVTAISNHSWGCAVDLTLKGILDKRGNGLIQNGLCAIAPIFNKFEWYWGAGFHNEDAMHFEVSKGLLEKWSFDLI